MTLETRDEPEITSHKQEDHSEIRVKFLSFSLDIPNSVWHFAAMKKLLQAGFDGRMLVPPEKRFPIIL